MLFYTNCARGLAKTNLYIYRLYLKEHKFLRLGAAPAPPLNTPMVNEG